MRRFQTTNEERNYAMFTHLAAFSGYVVPFGNVIGPLVVWLMKRHESWLVDDHGKRSLNFQISLMIWMLLCIPLMFVFVGFLLLLALLVIDIVFVIRNAIRASNEEAPYYPLSLQLVR
jgi:uncharacterized Tic20 family protein